MKLRFTSFVKVVLLVLVVIAVNWTTGQAQVKIGSVTDVINPAAALEIEAGPYPGNLYRGLLLPKVPLINYATWSLTGVPTDGMLVFNMATTTGNYPVTPGVYCWYNFHWNRQIQDNKEAIIASVDCQTGVPATGTYYNSLPLTSSNKKQITIVPASAGAYTASTGTNVNGYSFTASGTFTAAQVGVPQTITLQASGVPKVSGTDTFTLTTDTQTCTFSVNVATYIDCSGPLTGTYKVNVPLDASNTKQITFVPLTAGDYTFLAFVYTSIGTSFSFSKNATFTAAQLGISQTITLLGGGTPKDAGSFFSDVIVAGPQGNGNSNGCRFDITIVP